MVVDVALRQLAIGVGIDAKEIDAKIFEMTIQRLPWLDARQKQLDPGAIAGGGVGG